MGVPPGRAEGLGLCPPVQHTARPSPVEAVDASRPTPTRLPPKRRDSLSHCHGAGRRGKVVPPWPTAAPAVGPLPGHLPVRGGSSRDGTRQGRQESQNLRVVASAPPPGPALFSEGFLVKAGAHAASVPSGELPPGVARARQTSEPSFWDI